MKLKLLLNKLTPYLPNHDKSTITNLLIVVLAMMDKRTVCLNKLKSAVGVALDKPSVKVESHYVRLVRFFKGHANSELWVDIIRCGLQLIRLKCRYLVLDGTSWKRGEVWHHYITLCVVYRGVAIPIIWQDLAKKGSSSTEERTTLFDLALEHFTLSEKVLLADREYIGNEWFKYLINKQIDFVIRSRDYSYFSLIDQHSNGRTVEEMIGKVLRSRKSNKALRKAFQLSKDGPLLWIIVAKNPHPNGKEDFMILITSVDQNKYITVADYLKRWKIEHCFRQLKSNGFDLEVMNLGSLKRRRLLMAVTVLTYIISVVESLKDYEKCVPMKKHGRQGTIYRAQSVFRYGIDQLTMKMQKIITFTIYLVQELQAATTGYRSSNIINV